MSRKIGPEGGTKDKIVLAALKVFMEKGYEETSVRMILEEAGAVVGSFYHYFSSKEALFEAAIERFLTGYADRITDITSDDSKSFMDRLHLLLEEAEQGVLTYFGNMQAGKLHWTVQYALHKRTLQAILPGVQHMVERALEDKTAKNRLNMSTQMLSSLVVHGIEGILHAAPLDTADAEQIGLLRNKAEAYTALLLDIKPVSS